MPQARPEATRLDNVALEAELSRLARRWREDTVGLVAHIAEVEVRDLHLRQGYASLFTYCRQALAVSEHDAYTLVAAARVARKFPVILPMLAEGAIHLMAVKLLAPCLTFDNHRQVLEAARGKRRSEIEQLAATLTPEPEMPAAITRLLSPGVQPSSADRYRVQLTISADTAEKLRLAKDMLRHAVPSGDEASVLERAVSTLLADLAKKKFAAVDRPRPPREGSPGSRHIPAEVKRAVWLRDLGRCVFTSPTGRRCGERGFLEFHHVRPYAAGGSPTASNIELRCRRHNDYEARAFFGRKSSSRPERLSETRSPASAPSSPSPSARAEP